MSPLENLRIPTFLGLLVLTGGILAGVYLTGQNQILSSKAAPQISPKNITVTNIEDHSVAISWQTDLSSPGFITFGTNSPQGQTVLDDRDTDTPTQRATHFATLSKLSPETYYQFRVFSGKSDSGVKQFKTASTGASNNLKPIIGSVLDGSKQLNAGLVYLQVGGASLQSSIIKNLGNFVIPISQMRKEDLSEVYSPDPGTIAKLTVYSEDGRSATATFILKDGKEPLPPLKISQDLDLTGSSLGISAQKARIPGDINGDGVVNSFDLISPKKSINH